ncbi:MAG: hypothetical protein AB7J35_04090 [Dehalococcoidia bacterium]
MSDIERKIFFYRIDCGSDASGALLPFQHRQVLAYLDTLDWNSLRLEDPTAPGDHFAIWHERNRPDEVVFGRTRRSSLPRTEDGGRLTSLRLRDSAGIAELIHVTFFPENIVGAEFNFFGPRIGKLAYFLMRQAVGICPELHLGPLVKPDIQERLQRLEDLRIFDLVLDSSTVADVVRVAPDLGNALRQQIEFGGAGAVELVLRRKPYSRDDTLSPDVLATARALAADPDVHDAARKFVVTGYDPQLDTVDEIDILNDSIMTTRRMLRLADRERAVEANSAFNAIRDAYDELRDDIGRAIALR